MDFYLTAILLGLGFASLAMGIFISMRIFNIPDITTDGSFALGGAVTAVLLVQGLSFPIVFAAAFLAGVISGMITGMIHARLKVNALLAGILVMTALYSVNLAILGRSNIPLNDATTPLTRPTFLSDFLLQQALVLLVIILAIWQGIGWLLKTDYGLAMRATGSNERMIRSLGVNTGWMKIMGLGLANGLTAVSGFLITQVQGFADINMGIGIVILGLGSVMIGEVFSGLFGFRGIIPRLMMVISGSILFRILLAFALSFGVDAIYLKLIVAVFVLLVVSLPGFRKAHD